MSREELGNRRFSIINRARLVHAEGERRRFAAANNISSQSSSSTNLSQLPTYDEATNPASDTSTELPALNQPGTLADLLLDDIRRRNGLDSASDNPSAAATDDKPNEDEAPSVNVQSERSTRQLADPDPVCPPSPRPKAKKFGRVPSEKLFQKFSDGTVREISDPEPNQNFALDRVSSGRLDQTCTDTPMSGSSGKDERQDESEVVEDGLWQKLPAKRRSESAEVGDEEEDDTERAPDDISECDSNFSAFFPLLLDLCSTFDILLPREPKMDDPSNLLNPFDEARLDLRNIVFKYMSNRMRRRVFLYQHEIREGLVHFKTSSSRLSKWGRRKQKTKQRLQREGEDLDGQSEATESKRNKKIGPSPLSNKLWCIHAGEDTPEALRDVSNLPGTAVDTTEDSMIDVETPPNFSETSSQYAELYSTDEDFRVRIPGDLERPRLKITNRDVELDAEREDEKYAAESSFDESDDAVGSIQTKEYPQDAAESFFDESDDSFGLIQTREVPQDAAESSFDESDDSFGLIQTREVPDDAAESSSNESDAAVGSIQTSEVPQAGDGTKTKQIVMTTKSSPDDSWTVEMATASAHLVAMGFQVDLVAEALKAVDGNIGSALDRLLCRAMQKADKAKSQRWSPEKSEEYEMYPKRRKSQPPRSMRRKRRPMELPTLADFGEAIPQDDPSIVQEQVLEIRALHRFGPRLTTQQELQQVLNLTRAIDVLIGEIGRLWSAYKIISLCIGVHSTVRPDYDIDGLLERLNEFAEHARMGKVLSTAKARLEVVWNNDWNTEYDIRQSTKRLSLLPWLSKANVRRAVMEAALDSLGHRGVANHGMLGA